MAKKHADWLKVGVIFALLYFLSQVTAIYLPIILSVVLSFILNPLVDSITRVGPENRKIPRGWASFIAILVFVIVAAVVLTAIFRPLILEFNRFVANFPEMMQRIQNIVGMIEKSRIGVPQDINVYMDRMLASVSSYVLALGQRMLEALMGFFTQTISLVVVPVLTYYFLKDWKILRESCIAALPLAAKKKGDVIINDMSLAISGYLHGQALVSIIIGFLVFVGMYVLNVDYPLVLGLLATLTETIPIIGPIVGAAPALILAYLVSPALALKVLIFYLVIHQVENHIVVPKVMGTSIDLHPVTVILGILVGGQLFGILGMIMAVPLLALLKVLFKHLWWHYD